MGQSVKSYLEGKINGLLSEASGIAEKAETEGRDMSKVEKETVKFALDEVQKLKGQIAEIDERETLMKAIEDVRGPAITHIEDSIEGLSIGEAFTASSGYKALMEAGLNGKWTTGAVEYPMGHGGVKAIGMPIRSGAKYTPVSESASAVVPIDYQPGIFMIPTLPLTIADLIPSGATNSNQVTYIKEATELNSAGGVAEAAIKVESGMTFSFVNEPVVKLATFLAVTDEMMEDVAQIQSVINSRLSLFVQQTEESAILNGGGGTTLTGIMGRSGVQTSTALTLDGDSAIDAIYRAMVACRVNGGLEATAIVMHPNDWANTKLLKDANNQYFGGGPFVGQYGVGGIAGDQMWGLPVVQSTAMPAGNVLVGAFRTATQLFRRRGLTVEASNSHDTFFQYNLTAIRAEERLALAVYRPSAFYKITGYAALAHS